MTNKKSSEQLSASMAASRLISFSSPVRPNFSKEETTDPEIGATDEELHFYKEEELHGAENPFNSSPPATPEEKVSPSKEIKKLTKGRRRRERKRGGSTKAGNHQHPTLLPAVSCLSATCLLVTVATTVLHIVLDSVIGAAIILGVTCPIIGWGMLSLKMGKSTPLCIYGFLLVFESIALIVAGGLEAVELKSQSDITSNLSSGLPVNGQQTLADARRRTGILAAFTGLYFVCALVFVVTAVLVFQLYGEISLQKRLRLHRTIKAKGQQAEKAEAEKKKEGAVRVPAHRAPSPDLLDEEELLDVDVTGGGAPPQTSPQDSPQAREATKEEQVV